MANRLVSIALVCAAVFLGIPSGASAASHLWRFEQFFSTSDRKVQFIVMREIAGSDIETNISEHWYSTDSYNPDHSQLLGYNLPFGTAHKAFLVGTQSYAVLAALKNLPTPDYILPDGFFNPTGDTIVWWFYQTLTIPRIPTDGFHSLRVVNPASPGGFTEQVNAPINFAGQTGTVPLVVPAEPTHALALTALLLLCAAAWAARFTLRRARV